MVITENMETKARRRLDMDLAQRPKVGMLGRPNSGGALGQSYGDDQLRQIMGMAAMTPGGRR